ncbi:glycoside hydrolase family 71/99-like protein [Armatimonas rosea]|uniref:Glycosyl hydrolase family 99 n=1 Tax=Armatimonas rosea TaxID=685828 RepID=A0A7W9SWS4_ARMRO|nr:glycoside hydrolase family 71/99-like protein [Armatimonas rosea]MBB6053828.1 hypothetical protein [Armatimonas rosea]
MMPIVLTHYMPWFVAKPFRAVWGWHWTMNTFNPERQVSGKESQDKREIASHYYPLIGPYDSGDPAVLEYHLLLMKLSGIDGVIVDWYGLSDHLDYPILHQNTITLLKIAVKLGLKYAICYEDQTIPRLVEAKKLAATERVAHARRELSWLQQNWLREPGYVHLTGKPLLLSFGSDGLTDSEWSEVLSSKPGAPLYFSEHRKRSAATGRFDWPIPKDFPTSLDRFYHPQERQEQLIPVAFPRFHDCYAEGKAQATLGVISDDNGKTWKATLERALKSGADVIQLATWNDWGEGTGIEPTVEFGYRDLEVLQKLRGKKADLALPLRLYRLRQRVAPKAELDTVAQLLASGATSSAASLLKQVEQNGASS